MNSTLKNAFALLGVVCVLVACGYGLKGIYGAIYESGLEDQKSVSDKEIAMLKTELVRKTTEANKADKEKEDAFARLGDAERAKKEFEATKTMADAQHKAFVAIVTSARRMSEKYEDYLELPSYKGGKVTLADNWLGDVTFSATGVTVGKQEFDYTRDAAGDVVDLTFKVTPVTTVNNNYR